MVRRVSTTTSRRTPRSSNSEDRVTTAHDLVQAIQRVTPMVLRIFFLAYPIVTNVAFEAFSCFEFEGDSSWLIADVSIQCGTAEHVQAQSLAWVAIALYPIGLLLLNTTLLRHARRAIEFGPRTELSKALAFLHSEYKPQFLCAATAPR